MGPETHIDMEDLLSRNEILLKWIIHSRVFKPHIKILNLTLKNRSNEIISQSFPLQSLGSIFLAKRCVCQSSSHVLVFAIPWTIACQAPLGPWNSPDMNTGGGCHTLLQGTFLTQGLNPGLTHCRHIYIYIFFNHLSCPGSPWLKEMFIFFPQV